MKMVSVTTAAEFCDALENWIIDNKCNPTTQEEWNRCIEDMVKSGALTPVANIEDKDTDALKKTLTENFNVEEI